MPLGIEPGEIVRPTSAAEVGAVVAQAHAQGKTVIPWGGGTGQGYGHLPRRADVLLDLSGLNSVIAHEPGDLTVTVEAGATLASVQEALGAEHNQFLPLDPPDAEWATMGGIVAANAFGPSRVGYGSPRDWLIGLTVVDAQGRMIKGGGKVVKNVTGYDLPKLHIGALGTLGIVVEATFKVAPRPEVSRPLSFDLTETGPDAADAFLAALHDGTSPSFSLLREMAGVRVLVLLYSGPEEVAADEVYRANTLAAAYGVGLRTSFPADMDRPFDNATEGYSLVVRLTSPRGDSCRQHTALASRGAWQRIDTHPGTGHTFAYLNATDDPGAALPGVIQWAESHSAPLAILHAPTALRGEGAPIWRPLPPSLPLMRRLKETLDPKNTLNPGRFVGGI